MYRPLHFLLLIIFAACGTSAFAKGKAERSVLLKEQQAYTAELNACFEASAAKYQLDPRMLWAIAMVESRGRVNAINLTHFHVTKSDDLGVMQINSSWLPTLAKYGITREKLLADKCLNVDVGAWIFANLVQKLGKTWNTVGAYNAACKKKTKSECEKLRQKYIDLVWRWYINPSDRPAPATQPAFQDIVQNEQSNPLIIVEETD